MSTNQTDEPLNQRYSANRWNTKVSLECWQSGSIRRLLWFSDLQDAYLWVKEHTEQNRNINWILRSFTAIARDLDARWNDGDNGATIALGGARRFRVQYEPEATEATEAAGQRLRSSSTPSESSETSASAESNTIASETNTLATHVRLSIEQITAELNRRNAETARTRD
jgi:hypothetical protein